ncbi:MAG TPA: hypothetical protein EYP68_02580 [Candidatus Korarchaeota archaeon]|nr:hypothetical protein [Candidatus Korarchaeota archaeon]
MLAKGTERIIALYSLIIGITYLIIGVLEFVMGIWSVLMPWAAVTRLARCLTGFLGLPMDIFGGLSAIVIGATYFGAFSLWKGKHESLGFVLVATMLSAVFGVLYLLIIGARGLEVFLTFLSGEEEWNWEWITSGTTGLGLLRPEIWLFLLSLPLAFLVWKKAKFITIKSKKVI